jgi:hypothetical protein
MKNFFALALTAIMLFVAFPADVNAASVRYVQNFEQGFTYGTYEISYTQGHTTVRITGATVANVQPGPYGWRFYSLTPECECAPSIRIDFDPPILATNFEVTASVGHESQPPVVVCWSTYDYGLIWRTGPGNLGFTYWSHVKAMQAGAGYYQIGGSGLVGIIKYCTVKSGDVDNIAITELTE